MTWAEPMFPPLDEQRETHSRARRLSDNWWPLALPPAEHEYVVWIADEPADRINVADARAVGRIWARLYGDAVS